LMGATRTAMGAVKLISIIRLNPYLLYFYIILSANAVLLIYLKTEKVTELPS
jgi:hypothetical protein